MSKRRNSNTKSIKMYMYQLYGKRCMLCDWKPRGKKNKKHFLTYHHLVDYSKGGPTTEENGAILCNHCHEWFNRQKPGVQKKLNAYLRKVKKERRRIP